MYSLVADHACSNSDTFSNNLITIIYYDLVTDFGVRKEMIQRPVDRLLRGCWGDNLKEEK
jgi:hypothetical protein